MTTAQKSGTPFQSQKLEKPAAEFRDSNLRVTIWRRTDSQGRIRYNVAIIRSYQANGEWKETPYLGKLDLQRASKLLDRADDWIFHTTLKDRDLPTKAHGA